jgi:hypothetical protein
VSAKTLQGNTTPSGGGGGMVPLLIANGWTVSCTMLPEILPDGGRQIIDFHLPVTCSAGPPPCRRVPAFWLPRSTDA